MSHAPLAPSSLHRRVYCRGSYNMEGLTVQDDTPEAREGTAAHEVVAHLLRTGELMPLGAETSGGLLVDAAMQDAAMGFAAVIRDARPSTGTPLHIEERVSCSEIHPDCWGTPDVWFTDPLLLDVSDFKYGHDLVEVFENWQLLAYVFGIAQALHIDGLVEMHVQVRMRIYQPRAYHREGPCREWVTTLAHLRAYRNILQQVAVECLAEDAPTVAGEWCLNCSAAYRCEALHRFSSAIASAASVSVPLDLTPAQISSVLAFLQAQKKVLKARIAGLEEQALKLAERGAYLPQHMLAYTRPLPRWKKPLAEVLALGDLFGISLLASPEAVSPSRAKNMGIDGSVIMEYSESPTGSRKLVPADTTQLRKIFYERP